MKCTFQDKCPSELDFTRLLMTEREACIGMEVSICFHTMALASFLAAVPTYHELLWANYSGDVGEDRQPVFTMCTAHWIRVACTVGYVGMTHNDINKVSTAGKVIIELCRQSNLDYREMTNFLKSLGST